jgi:hypothetical protein
VGEKRNNQLKNQAELFVANVVDLFANINTYIILFV